VETRLFAALGADFLGERAQYELQKHGVPTAFLQVVPKGTGICCALVEENGERTLLTYRGANSLLGPELPPGWLEGADWLHISGYALLEPSSRAAVFSAVEEARARKIPVSLDPGMVFVHQPGLDFEELFPVMFFCPIWRRPRPWWDERTKKAFSASFLPSAGGFFSSSAPREL
jgi:sugar/nucleoside kinase (ribokinase family)